jgi:hypothetical protein
LFAREVYLLGAEATVEKLRKGKTTSSTGPWVDNFVRDFKL